MVSFINKERLLLLLIAIAGLYHRITGGLVPQLLKRSVMSSYPPLSQQRRKNTARSLSFQTVLSTQQQEQGKHKRKKEKKKVALFPTTDRARFSYGSWWEETGQRWGGGVGIRYEATKSGLTLQP